MAPPNDKNSSQTELRNRMHTTVVDPKSKLLKEFSWQEIAQHNTADSAWVSHRGKVYDVTDFVNRHPGGSEMILLHAGREITDTFESYHPFSSRAPSLLAKFEIGQLKANESEFPVYKPDSGFYKTCCERIAEYFKTHQIDSKSAFPGIWRMVLVFMTAFVSYCFVNHIIPAPAPIQFFFAAIFGVCQALPLLHVMHDSSHAAFSTNPTWWSFVGRFAMDWFAGGNMTSWLNQHVVGHHIYTNVAGADPDLPVNFNSDLRRIVERQVFQPCYKWQHIYLPPLYGLLGLKFRVQDVLDTFISRTNGPVRVNPHTLQAWLSMIVSKLCWATYRIYIPLVLLEISSGRFWSLFFLTEFVTGWYLAFNFQVSHVSTECDYFNDKVVDGNLQEEWAISQVKSSVDYSHNSPVTTFLAGALNYQTVHHLFPGVSQYHYPAIAPIIQQVCKEYKIKYNLLPSFWSAILAHFVHLKIMGEQGEPVSIHMG